MKIRETPRRVKAMTVETSRKGRNSSMTEDSYSSQELLHDSRKVGNSLLHVEQSILAALCPVRTCRAYFFAVKSIPHSWHVFHAYIHLRGTTFFVLFF
ncbi:hypothetical protein CDAR_55031 [Caerostris darwini]|uniref:C2H2-type domain-containing protein n=1 Tax=Caerostris darwini TaxID=1538125 RepID=A0AAV4PAX4_9ARAC|nr:hypothetical protein CDAR_55031 [Caerostris darwini]